MMLSKIRILKENKERSPGTSAVKQQAPNKTADGGANPTQDHIEQPLGGGAVALGRLIIHIGDPCNRQEWKDEAVQKLDEMNNCGIGGQDDYLSAGRSGACKIQRLVMQDSVGVKS